MDKQYWESQSAAMLREYRTLQGFADVARNEGTPEMQNEARKAMDAVWALVTECDRKAKQESRNEGGSSCPGQCVHGQWHSSFCAACEEITGRSGRCAHGVPLSGSCLSCNIIAHDPVQSRHLRLTEQERDRLRTRNLIGAPARLPARLGTLGH